jgi:dCTP deaminase
VDHSVRPGASRLTSSVSSGLKNSGLVNINGFHVDPGNEEELLFAIFNAEPQTVTVRRDQDALMSLIPAETASMSALSRRMD